MFAIKLDHKRIFGDQLPTKVRILAYLKNKKELEFFSEDKDISLYYTSYRNSGQTSLWAFGEPGLNIEEFMLEPMK